MLAASGNGVVKMPDYRELYLKLFLAVQDAIKLLNESLQECEELFISSFNSDDPETEP